MTRQAKIEKILRSIVTDVDEMKVGNDSYGTFDCTFDGEIQWVNLSMLINEAKLILSEDCEQ